MVIMELEESSHYVDIVSSVLQIPLDEKSAENILDSIEVYENMKLLGAGRSLGAGRVLSHLAAEAGYNTTSFGDSGFPSKYTNKDFVLGVTGSGKSLVDEFKKAKTAGAELAIVTTNPQSPAAAIVEDANGIIYTIPANDKETLVAGKLTLGSLFELSATHGLSSIGLSLNNGSSVGEYHKKIAGELKKYVPAQEAFGKMYGLFPPPDPKHKIKIITNELGNIFGDFAAIRFEHCAKDKEDRRVELHKGKVPTKPGDLIIAYSLNGDIYEYVKKELSRGANLLAITESNSSPLANIKPAPQYTLIIPTNGHITDDSASELEQQLYFDLKTAFVFESLVPEIMAQEGLTLEDLAKRHALTG